MKRNFLFIVILIVVGLVFVVDNEMGSATTMPITAEPEGGRFFSASALCFNLIHTTFDFSPTPTTVDKAENLVTVTVVLFENISLDDETHYTVPVIANYPDGHFTNYSLVYPTSIPAGIPAGNNVRCDYYVYYVQNQNDVQKQNGVPEGKMAKMKWQAQKFSYQDSRGYA